MLMNFNDTQLRVKRIVLRFEMRERATTCRASSVSGFRPFGLSRLGPFRACDEK